MGKKAINERLKKEWDYEKNNGEKPEDYTAGSNKFVYWKCSKCGYSWIDSINHRTQGRGCPACSGKAVFKGVNDLATLYPEIVKEWDYALNGEKKPDMYTAGSDETVYWYCSTCKKSWSAKIYSRTSGRRCPVCFGQKVVKGYNDLATLHPKLVEEWDFDLNVEITPDEVREHSNIKVYWRCKKCNHSWKARICDRVGGRNCPACAGKAVNKGYNDLATVDPNLAAEWDYDENGNLTPDMFTVSSNVIVCWKCKEHQHKWKASINSRHNGNGCPVCVNQEVLEGFNDLKTLKPEIAKYWDYEKNVDLRPEQVTPYSTKKAYFLCENNHSTLMRIQDKTNGCGCYKCMNMSKGKKRLI